MSIIDHLEVHFYDQDEFSVLLETNGGPDEQLGEILMCSSFAVRQILNMGSRTPPALSLVDYLACLQAGIKDVGALDDSSGPHLVAYRGIPGRRRFLADLHCEGGAPRFNLRAKGFGLRATGMGYYAPTAVGALVSYLVTRRREDDEYCAQLARAMAHCAGSFLGGSVTIANQGQVTLAAATRPAQGHVSATGEALDGPPVSPSQGEPLTGLSQMKPQISDAELGAVVRRSTTSPTYDELLELFKSGQHAISWGTIDLATKNVFELLVRQQVAIFLSNFPDAVPEDKSGFERDLKLEIGQYLLDGYLIGRTVFGTQDSQVTRPTPEPVEDYHAARLHHLLSSLTIGTYVDAAGADVGDFLDRFAEVHAKQGAYGRLSVRDQASDAALLVLLNGFALSVAEHLLFEVEPPLPREAGAAT